MFIAESVKINYWITTDSRLHTSNFIKFFSTTAYDSTGFQNVNVVNHRTCNGLSWIYLLDWLSTNSSSNDLLLEKVTAVPPLEHIFHQEIENPKSHHRTWTRYQLKCRAMCVAAGVTHAGENVYSQKTGLYKFIQSYLINVLHHI